MVLYFLVVRENRFAAATVDVVEGQTVVATGPYAVVRHPMYAGAILVSLGAPLALGSWWGFLLTLIVTGILSLRLLDEERYLRHKLAGYAEYTRVVPYRLLPYIW
jgi:protein-S-isoprenylcysteine O-methyltransferase Ste14